VPKQIMSFEATLSSAAPDRQRIQRLCFATLLSVGLTTAGLAGSWALEQLGVERVGGPRSAFELVEFSLLAPKPVDPPPPPPDIEPVLGGGGGDPGPKREIIEEPSSTGIEADPPSHRIPDIGARGGDESGIPSGGGCPAGICGTGPISSTTGPGCVGPHCSVAKRPDPAPVKVAFSALHCLACSDPDHAELRQTASSRRKQGGNVALRFCVDARGRVDADSIDVTQSFGDDDVDRIARAAVSRWHFKPMQIAGEPRRACSETRFRITFD
jgi:TonB family protein